MASGTPVLTTKLPGMPEEYYPYVYLFEDETTEGMAKTLGQVLCLPEQELREMGIRGKQFVLSKKNNVYQTQKIVNLLK